MHFHLPKPLHGWREFVGGVWIIVIGVLIALSAEQLIEAVHQREKAIAPPSLPSLADISDQSLHHISAFHPLRAQSRGLSCHAVEAVAE